MCVCARVCVCLFVCLCMVVIKGQLENTESRNSGNGKWKQNLLRRPAYHVLTVLYTVYLSEGIGAALVRQWEANGGKL